MTKSHYGIIFTARGDGNFVSEISRRTDLAGRRLEVQTRDKAALDRAKRSSALTAPVQQRYSRIELGGVVVVGNLEIARSLKKLLDRRFGGRVAGVYTEHELTGALTACRRNGLSVVTMAPKPPSKGPRITDRRVISKAIVPDPMVQGDQLAHQLEEDAQKPSRRPPGYTRADVNLDSLIGGLARMKHISEPQRNGARDFRTTAEQAQLGGAKAIDYSVTRVDTSGPTAGMAETIGADARAEYTRAREALGVGTLDLAAAESIIVQGRSIAECAEGLGLGSSGHARRRVARAIRRAVNVLAFHYGHDRRARRTGTRVERPERPAVFEQDVEGTRYIASRA